jgi:Flp pilus assembly protein TadD
VVWSLRRRAGAVLGSALLVLPLLPALYVPLLGDNAGAERYAYLPSAGAALVLASAIEAWRARGPGRALRVAGAGAAAAVLLAATSATLAHNAVWRDDVTLWTDAVAKAPSSASAHESLGTALIVAGRPGLAVAALERAIALAPERAEPRLNLASALVSAGRPDEALAAAEGGVRALPSVAEAHGILGLALAAKGRHAEAVAAYERALSLNPSLPDVHDALGVAWEGLGRRDLAVQHVREALRLQPENPRYQRNLALLLAR